MSPSQSSKEPKKKTGLSGTVSNERQVLVKWIGGHDDGRLDIINISWLKNFDETQWNSMSPSDRSDKSEVAEWRVGKKSAAGTWTSFDCEVILISDNIRELNKKKEELKKIKDSGRDAGDKNSNDDDDSSEETQATEAEPGNESTINKKRNASAALKSLDNLRKKITSAEHEKNAAASATKSDKDNGEKSRKKKKKTKSENSKIPIYKGSVYMVDKTAYDHAKRRGPREFVTAMLRQLYSEKILVVSNLRGGKSTIGSASPQRWSLDRPKRLALITAATDVFPDLSKAQCHVYITKFINSLRFRLKKKEKLQAYEEKGRKIMGDRPYKEDGSSEEDEGSDSSSSGED